LTVIAGALTGLNRRGHGRSAGRRTTLLVCLAAAAAMIHASAVSSHCNRALAGAAWNRKSIGLLGAQKAQPEG
jgi:uncharacterized membrane protein YhiD involved in acid resistance